MRKILQLHLRRMLLVAMVAVGITMPLVAQTFTANRLNYSISNGEATIVSFVKGEKIDTLRIPDVIEYNNASYPVVAIADKAFRSSSSTVAAYMGANIKTIGNEAFAMDSKLDTVYLNEGLLSIGNYAFQNSKLTFISLPASLTHFGECVFKGNKTLVGLSLAAANTHFSYTNGILMNNTEHCIVLCPGQSPESVTIAPGMTHICGSAFTGKTLQMLSLPSSLTTIGESAFENCTALTTV